MWVRATIETWGTPSTDYSTFAVALLAATIPFGSAHANRTKPLLVIMYWRPSSSYEIGELCIGDPVPACRVRIGSLFVGAMLA